MTNHFDNRPELNIAHIFSHRLIYLMEIAEISSEELARQVYVSRTAISNYRQGIRTPDIERLYLIAEALHTSADYLIGRSDQLLPPPG